MRIGKMLGGEDAEEVESLFFVSVEEQKEVAGEKVERLTVANAGLVNGEGLQDATKRSYHRSLS